MGIDIHMVLCRRKRDYATGELFGIEKIPLYFQDHEGNFSLATLENYRNSELFGWLTDSSVGLSVPEETNPIYEHMYGANSMPQEIKDMWNIDKNCGCYGLRGISLATIISHYAFMKCNDECSCLKDRVKDLVKKVYSFCTVAGISPLYPEDIIVYYWFDS